MTFGEGLGLIGLLRSWLLDRPRVAVVVRVVDHEPAGRGTVAQFEGKKWIHLAVHCTGARPVRVEAVGFELDTGDVVPAEVGDTLPATLTRPETLERHLEMAVLSAAVRAAGEGRHLRGIRVDVGPDVKLREKLPKTWRRFPDVEPPAPRGPVEGFLAMFF